jgi:hypothetical protein
VKTTETTAPIKEYMREALPEAHGHQIKGISDFIAAIIERQTGNQAELWRKLTDTDVMQEACDALNTQLPLEAEGYVCRGTDLWQIMLGASVKQMTIHGMCESLEKAPSDVAVRGYLNAQLTVENLPEIEDRLNAALAGQIPRRVFKRARDTAMDFHEQAYYGKTKQADGLWIRAEAKDGTTRFYRVATAYVIWRDQRGGWGSSLSPLMTTRSAVCRTCSSG